LFVIFEGRGKGRKSFQVDEYSLFKSVLSAVTILLSLKVKFQLFAILQNYASWVLPVNSANGLKTLTLSDVIVATISMF